MQEDASCEPGQLKPRSPRIIVLESNPAGCGAIVDPRNLVGTLGTIRQSRQKLHDKQFISRL